MATRFKVICFKIIFFLLLFVSTPLLEGKNCLMEVRAGYLVPASHNVRRHYADQLFTFEFQANYAIASQWQVWGNVGWTVKRKKHRFNRHHLISTYLDTHRYHRHTRRKIWYLPVSFGVNYLIPICADWNLYGGVGVSYAFVRNEEKVAHFYHSSLRQKAGIVLKSGFLWTVGKYTYFDFFVDYVGCEIEFNHCTKRRKFFTDYNDLDLSGIKYGVGYGIYF